MFDVGEKVLVRTVTYHMVGEIVSRDGDWLILKGASWVADTGRLGDAVKNGTLAEAEHVGDAAVNLAAAVDAFPWHHELPDRSL
jgi:hypothetical protein